MRMWVWVPACVCNVYTCIVERALDQCGVCNHDDIQVLNQIAQQLGCRDLLALCMVCKELQSQLRLCLPAINLGIPVAATIPAGRGYIAQIAASLHKYLPGVLRDA